MKSTKNSMAKYLLLDRSVNVDMHFADTSWAPLSVEAKVDTGADGCSVDEGLALYLGWEEVSRRTVKSSLGKESRPVFRGKVDIRGVKFWMDATATDRGDLSHPVLVGHDVIKDLVLLEEE